MAAGFVRLAMHISLLAVRDCTSSLHPLGVRLSVACLRDRKKSSPLSDSELRGPLLRHLPDLTHRQR
jgi:hypothetical protein